MAHADQQIRPSPVPLHSVAAVAPASSLPATMNPIVGRDGEIAAIVALASRQDVRLVTLTGPGGVGKTRLAVEVGRRLAADGAFSGGVVFVPLAALADPALVLPAVGLALDLPDDPAAPLGAALAAALRERALLLVLDNFEQVLAAGPALADLLAAAPTLTVLVTSRTRLRLYGEHDVAVPPLAVPEQDGLPPGRGPADYGAVRLFVDRYLAVRPDAAVTPETLTAVAAVCRRLDGLPLAIELAAARGALLSPQAILARLDNRLTLLTGGARDHPARLRTMRGAIAWSHDLLDPEQQAFFRRLAVFAGGFTLEAAEAVAGGAEDDGEARQEPDGADPPAPHAPLPRPASADAFDLVAALVDASLLRLEQADDGEPRVGMLETIREYGLERLAAAGEEGAARRAHAAHFLTLAEDSKAGLLGPDPAAWLARLDREHGNLRNALTWTLDAGDADSALGLCAALWQFWSRRGHAREGAAWLERALALPVSDPGRRAASLRGAGALAEALRDYPRAVAAYEEALALWRASGNRKGEAAVLVDLGSVSWDQGDLGRAVALYTEALAIDRTLGDGRNMARTLGVLGTVAIVQGDYGLAERNLTECIALMRSSGDLHGLGATLANLGELELLRGNTDRAESLIEEGLALRRTLGDPHGIAMTLTQLAKVALARGAHERAGGLLTESLRVMRDLGDSQGEASALYYLADSALAQGDAAAATGGFQASLLLFQRMGDTTSIPSCLTALAAVAAGHGDPVRAARLFGAAERLGAELGVPVPPDEADRRDRAVASARAALGPEAYAAARSAGESLPLAEAVAAACAVIPGTAERPASAASAPDPQPSEREPLPDPLTPREREVLLLLVEGRPDREIAAALFISSRTASNHVASILAKLGADTRTAAATAATRLGLV